MKLSKIEIKSFLGARDVNLVLDKPVTIVSGANYAGKTSIAEAVRLALLAEPERVSLKKDYPRMITEGGMHAEIKITTADGDETLVGIHYDGTITDSAKGRDPDSALAVCLDPHRFADMTGNERRTFLFALMGVSTDGPAVRERLIVRGCDERLIESVIPILRTGGFPGACEEAKTKARDAKTLWRGVTGETYGEKKGELWRAPKPDFKPEDLQQALRDQGSLDERLATKNQQLGSMEAQAKAASVRAGRMAQLREVASRYGRINTKLEHDKSELERLQGILDALPPPPGGPEPTTYPCPCCGVLLTFDLSRVGHGGMALEQYTPLEYQRDDGIEQRRDQYARAVGVMDRSILNDETELERAATAKATLAELEQDKDASPPPKPEEIVDVKGTIEVLRKKKADLSAHIAELRAADTAREHATRNTERAAGYHQEVLAWAKIADALAPDGIPAEIMGAALDPFNSRLEQSSLDTTWPKAAVGADMAITYGGRSYDLCSESEQWRADAMLAEAVSFLSKHGLLVLDRADLLHIPSRAELFEWLNVLADNAEIGTAIVLATLKAPPQIDGIRSYWIEGGKIKGWIEEDGKMVMAEERE